MTGFQSKRQASKDLLKQALDALMCCSPDHKAGAALQIKTVAELRAHLAEPAVAHPDPWREAIDAELVCLHLGTADSFPDAGAALNALINWHVQVALDPEVSSDAQALIDRGAAQAAPEPVAWDVFELRLYGAPQEKQHRVLWVDRYTYPDGSTPDLDDLLEAAKTEGGIDGGAKTLHVRPLYTVRFARAVEQAHGIKRSAA